MKGVIVVSLLALLLPAPVIAQTIHATTREGMAVLLHPDGRWEFADQQQAHESVAAEAGTHSRPDSSTKLVKGKRGSFGIWLDAKKWRVKRDPANADAMFELTHANGDGYALVIAERIAMPLETLRKVAIDNANAAAEDVEVVHEEKRTVNGTEILLMQINGTIQSIPFTYYSYYYTGKGGSIQFITYTGSDLFAEYKADFEDLLNGFEVYPK